jgi:hypothetical protein
MTHPIYKLFGGSQFKAIIVNERKIVEKINFPNCLELVPKPINGIDVRSYLEVYSQFANFADPPKNQYQKWMVKVPLGT